MDDLFAPRLPQVQVLLDRMADARNVRLTGDRALASSWKGRAEDNVLAIRLANRLRDEDRPATPEEQDHLLRFIGFGATDMANGMFPLGRGRCKPGWEQVATDLRQATTPDEFAGLQRATQYAHYTPEYIVRALWEGVHRLGFRGGSVIEPGCGTGLFWALMPAEMAVSSILTGIENDPVTARIARLLHPKAKLHSIDFTHPDLTFPPQDLAIGNPPFSDRTIKGQIGTISGLSLHEFFLARAIQTLRPGGIGAFVVSRWLMDKGEQRARALIAGMADLAGAIRLPAAAMRAAAGTDVVVDLLFFRRRDPDAEPAGLAWINTARAEAEGTAGGLSINQVWTAHPAAVLGRHALTSSQFGPAYTCIRHEGLDHKAFALTLDAAISRLGGDVLILAPTIAEQKQQVDLSDPPPPARQGPVVRVGTASDGATIKEGSYFLDPATGDMHQVIDGVPERVEVRSGRGTQGMFASHAAIIRGLIPIRDAVREVLRAQEADRPWEAAQERLGAAYAAFTRRHGPINKMIVSKSEPDEDGDVVERSRRPNLSPMMDDPDCFLVAAIENYDAESGIATRGPIFTRRVIAPPPERVINSTVDALAVTLNESGKVAIDRIAYLTECTETEAIERLGSAVFLDPATGRWETDDAYLSGQVRIKLTQARNAAAMDEQWQRNVDALLAVQPVDLNPSEITARLGAPWLPARDIMAFVLEVVGVPAPIVHTPEIAAWAVSMGTFAHGAAATSEWGTTRRHAGLIIEDALNNRTPAIYDYETDAEGRKIAVLNAPATEAAKEKLAKVKEAFTSWVWTDADRATRLARLYNDLFNNLVDRQFSGSHLMLPGASPAVQLRPHQKRVIWRIIASGNTYISHAVGAGKTFAIAAALMEQKRLGLVSKPMLVVPGHCLAQFSREFVQLYPAARILVADETNFTKHKRARFLARAATGTWDAIIITHSAFKFISVPAGVERGLIQDQLSNYEALLERDDDNRITRKRLERVKEALEEKLHALRARKDDMVTLNEMGVDQIVVDEAQAMRKLSFATNMSNLRGIDPNGSQIAWDLFVKSRFLAQKNPRRPLILSSGTPITNTMGEMYTLQRFMQPEMLDARLIGEFDAWALTFGDTRTELELQPSGLYKPVTRFSEFVNVPELVSMFRAVADVIHKDDLREFVKLPAVQTGQRQVITAPASDSFKLYQKLLAKRIKDIERRGGMPKKGDDILLSVITDGRHAAIDLRLVGYSHDEQENKLNALVRNVHRIWLDTAATPYTQPGGAPYARPGAAQMIFSDLGTLNVEEQRGFSAYRWIKDQLVALGVPPAEVAFMQHHKTSTAKQRLFDGVNGGQVRVLIGSSETMGTGVNAQTRLIALHHLDVPWLPSQIGQREGRIERQGNQNPEVAIYAYATLGSMDAPMWQTNERKARFIAAVLSGNRDIRRLEDMEGNQANQFAMAKAIASGDARLMHKAGLEAEIARLRRQRSAHYDDQHSIRYQIQSATDAIARCERRIPRIRQDIETWTGPQQEDAFTMEVMGQTWTERPKAGAAILSRLRELEDRQEHGDFPIGAFAGFTLTATGSTPRASWRKEGKYELSLAVDFHTGPKEVAANSGSIPASLARRIEDAPGGFQIDLHDTQAHLAAAQARLADYAPRLGGAFGFQQELDAKEAELATLDHDLASTKEEAA